MIPDRRRCCLQCGVRAPLYLVAPGAHKGMDTELCVLHGLQWLHVREHVALFIQVRTRCPRAGSPAGRTEQAYG